MSDIVERLRAWVYTDSQYATAREAADEIERLRNGAVERRETVQCPHVVGKTTLHCSLTPLALTDAERKAIMEASDFYVGTRTGVTLRGLLERTLAAVASDCADR
jgi:hypothetical protein